MDIYKYINSLKQFEQEFNLNYCIINGKFIKINEIHKMGYEKFSIEAKKNIPLKLYKYFPNIEKKIDGKNINYSLEALKNNTIFLQKASEFDDTFDSEMNIEIGDYERIRLKIYCQYFQIDVNENTSETIENLGSKLTNKLSGSYCDFNNFKKKAKKNDLSKTESLAVELFLSRVWDESDKLSKLRGTTKILEEAIHNVIMNEYKKYIFDLKNTFRVACFTTSPFLQLMWGGAYADCHRGFCLEYTILPNEKKYQKCYLNLFPMIYSRLRYNITKECAENKDKELTNDDFWNIYACGALQKSVDWVTQNEWRLLFVNKIESNYNVEFFPITKVFLGNRMSMKKRKEIIDICNEKNIPYVGVIKETNFFRMRECETKCEDCFK